VSNSNAADKKYDCDEIAKLNNIEPLNDLKIKSNDVNKVLIVVGLFLFKNNNIFNNPNDKPIKNNSDEK